MIESSFPSVGDLEVNESGGNEPGEVDQGTSAPASGESPTDTTSNTPEAEATQDSSKQPESFSPEKVQQAATHLRAIFNPPDPNRIRAAAQLLQQNGLLENSAIADVFREQLRNLDRKTTQKVSEVVKDAKIRAEAVAERVFATQQTIDAITNDRNAQSTQEGLRAILFALKADEPEDIGMLPARLRRASSIAEDLKRQSIRKHEAYKADSNNPRVDQAFYSQVGSMNNLQTLVGEEILKTVSSVIRSHQGILNAVPAEHRRFSKLGGS